MNWLREKPRPRLRRDPKSTRILILETAQTIFAPDVAAGLGVSSLAKLAGVNCGTDYQHFQLKEDLIRATLDWLRSYASSKKERNRTAHRPLLRSTCHITDQ